MNETRRNKVSLRKKEKSNIKISIKQYKWKKTNLITYLISIVVKNKNFYVRLDKIERILSIKHLTKNIIKFS